MGLGNVELSCVLLHTSCKCKHFECCTKAAFSLMPSLGNQSAVRGCRNILRKQKPCIEKKTITKFPYLLFDILFLLPQTLFSKHFVWSWMSLLNIFFMIYFLSFVYSSISTENFNFYKLIKLAVLCLYC